MQGLWIACSQRSRVACSDQGSLVAIKDRFKHVQLLFSSFFHKNTNKSAGCTCHSKGVAACMRQVQTTKLHPNNEIAVPLALGMLQKKRCKLKSPWHEVLSLLVNLIASYCLYYSYHSCDYWNVWLWSWWRLLLVWLFFWVVSVLNHDTCIPIHNAIYLCYYSCGQVVLNNNSQ